MSAPPAVSESPGTRAPLWAHLIGTFFFIGHCEPGPGTWASIATVVIWWFTIAHRAWWIAVGIRAISTVPVITAAAALLVTLIGIPAATAVARAWKKKDPSQVVIDEVAGQLVTLIACPITASAGAAIWKPALTALILFRVFDILKPPPVRQLEALPEGTGIMLDDIGAGIYAWIVLHLLLHYGFLR
jgi:phosphatidylglycerophosphatase A